MSRDRFLDRHHRYFPLDTIHWIQVDSLMRSQPLGEKAVQDLKNQNISIWWNQRNGQVLWFHFHTTKNVHFDSKWLWVVSILSFINLESEMDLLVKHRDYLERPVRAHLLNDIHWMTFTECHSSWSIASHLNLLVVYTSDWAINKLVPMIGPRL